MEPLWPKISRSRGRPTIRVGQGGEGGGSDVSHSSSPPVHDSDTRYVYGVQINTSDLQGSFQPAFSPPPRPSPSLRPSTDRVCPASIVDAVPHRRIEMEKTKISGCEATKDFEREDHQDRLSHLPDDILLLILRGVPTHEAARTSVLSKRWMHLFRWCSSILMDAKAFCMKGVEDPEFTRDDLARSNARLIQATKTIFQCQRPIGTLSIKFCMFEESIDIVRCVDKAMTNRQISSTEFVLYPEHEEKKNWTEDLKINYGGLFMRLLGAGPCAFGGLSQLHIWCVKLSIEDMTNVLTACSNLEHLYLHWCHYGFESAMVIEHPRLATLTFSYCEYLTAELKWLPRLTRVTCEYWRQASAQYPISFGYVPQLSTLILGNATTIYHKTIQLSLGSTGSSKVPRSCVAESAITLSSGHSRGMQPKILAKPRLDDVFLGSCTLSQENTCTSIGSSIFWTKKGFVPR